jgi:hypothetical protein
MEQGHVVIGVHTRVAHDVDHGAELFQLADDATGRGLELGDVRHAGAMGAGVAIAHLRPWGYGGQARPVSFGNIIVRRKTDPPPPLYPRRTPARRARKRRRDDGGNFGCGLGVIHPADVGMKS